MALCTGPGANYFHIAMQHGRSAPQCLRPGRGGGSMDRMLARIPAQRSDP